MNVVLWILQIVLAVAFLAAGTTKVGQSKARLATRMGWVNDFSEGGVKAIGALEILAAIGLILPAALGITTVLTPLAALGLALVMAGAIVVHLRRKETAALPPVIVLLILVAVVAWGRFGPYSFDSDGSTSATQASVTAAISAVT